jgi:hypothetical protein
MVKDRIEFKELFDFNLPLAGAPEKAATPPIETRTNATVADVNFILLFGAKEVVMLLRMMYRIVDGSIGYITGKRTAGASSWRRT